MSPDTTLDGRSEPVLLKGNEACGEAAIRAGCTHFYGYPITPQGELLEYLAERLPEEGGTFLQSESELAGINMVYGAAAAGDRVITASSSVGIALMQEGITYLAAAELPCVIVNVNRAGPGLGRIAPSQSDYTQVTRGGGSGDYQTPVLAPWSVQETADLTVEAFDLADEYRTPVVLLSDGMLGQMAEPVTLPEKIDPESLPEKEWALTGATDRERNLVLAAPLTDDALVELNEHLLERYQTITENEQRWETAHLDGAELVIVAYGSAARISLAAIERAREDGIPVGMIRPVSLWPFPERAFREAEDVTQYLVVEMNNGQMVTDVEHAVRHDVPVRHHGKGGGWRPSPESLHEHIQAVWEELA